VGSPSGRSRLDRDDIGLCGSDLVGNRGHPLGGAVRLDLRVPRARRGEERERRRRREDRPEVRAEVEVPRHDRQLTIARERMRLLGRRRSCESSEPDAECGAEEHESVLHLPLLRSSPVVFTVRRR
jgi:hypothetical protein